MADKNIGSLPKIAFISDDALFPVEQQGAAGYVTGKQIRELGGGSAGSAANAVLYTAQKLTEEQQAQARRNIGAIPVPASATVGQTIIVKSVDENGKPTEWAVADLVGGLDITEKNLLLALFKNTAYTADMSATIAQLEKLWADSGNDSGGSGDSGGDTDNAGVTQSGSTLIIVSGVTASQSGAVLSIA